MRGVAASAAGEIGLKMLSNSTPPHTFRRLVQHLVELTVHPEHLVQLASGGVQQATLRPRRAVERKLLVDHHDTSILSGSTNINRRMFGFSRRHPRSP
jgi:hypothetical protein